MAKPIISKAAQEFAEPSADFFIKFRALVTSKAKDGDISDDDVKAIFRAARGYAGGKGKAKKRKEGMPMEATESLTDMIRDVDAALYTKYPDQHGSSKYWSRETFLDHVIVCDHASQKLYRIPYARNVAGEIEFGEFQEVEEEYVPIEMVELADLCAKNGKMRLFIEQQFSTPPEWMPLLPKPGEFKHPEYGKISITKERNANFIANFTNAVYQSKLPINAEHMLSEEGAYGWIVEMRQNLDDSVDAKVNWTDLGKDAIENDRFAYVSPEWVDEYNKNDDTKHKDVVLGAALCTRPFFKEDSMRPLVANESGLHYWSRPPAKDGMTFYFTAATPLTEVITMADEKKPDEKKADEVKPPDEKKADEPNQAMQFAELQNQVKTLSEQNGALKTANDSLKTAVDSLTKENRRKRFSDVVKEFSGNVENHIKRLEFIADHDEKGEESDMFKDYVTEQKALAAQLHASDLFKSIGDERGGEPKTAADELDALTKKYMTDNPTERLTYPQAYDRVMSQNPALYNRHTEETRKGVN